MKIGQESSELWSGVRSAVTMLTGSDAWPIVEAEPSFR